MGLRQTPGEGRATGPALSCPGEAVPPAAGAPPGAPASGPRGAVRREAGSSRGTKIGAVCGLELQQQAASAAPLPKMVRGSGGASAPARR